eukprot:2852478-Rhodomonas_salina.1
MSSANCTAQPMNFSQALTQMNFSQALTWSSSPTSQEGTDSKRSQLTTDVVLAIFELRPARSELD